MPRYDNSPRGHSPLERRDRRLKSPLVDRRRRDSPPFYPSMARMSSRDHLMYHHDDYIRNPHHNRGADLPPTTYKILCVSNISNKYPDSTVRNELMKEFARFGNPSIKLVYDKNTRIAYLYFNSYEDARDARHSKPRVILFDKQLIIDPIYDRVSTPRKRSLTPDYGRGSIRNLSPPIQRRLPPPPPQRSLNHDRYQLSHSNRDIYRENYGHQMNNRNNDYHHSNSVNSLRGQHNQQNQQQRESKKEKFPNYLHHIPPEEDDKSTRTLFVGNLEVTITEPDLRRIFERYGIVEDIDVKRPPPGQGNAYAFIKFLNLDMAHRAKVEMSGQYIGKFQCKIGYGKATPTTRIWLGGLGPWISVVQLDKEFDRFGAIRKIDYIKGDNHAYIQYDTIDAAQAACAAMRGYPLGGPDKRLRIDYADPGLFSTSPRPNNEPSSFGFNNSPRSSSNNNGTNYEYWGNNQDSNAPSPKRRRQQSPECDERKKSPNNFDSMVSPRISARESSPNYETANGKSEIKVTINENVTSISELIRCCPPTWSGGLILKSSGFALRMYFCSGDIQVVDLMKDSSTEHPILRITQRLRLESSKLEEVSRRISSSSSTGHCILIASQINNLQLNFSNCTSIDDASSSTTTPVAVQQRPIRNLVTYLKSKDAAGVVLLPGKSSTNNNIANNSNQPNDQQNQSQCESTKNVLYLFPPHPFSLELIQRIAPNISADSANKEDYFVIVLVRGGGGGSVGGNTN
ncbi:Putative RNA-binding protein 15B [Sarcoptes scabiei]|uniref:Putative RNA-binding protein 15B n=1 Tax=Sarcoptes scabiei TaxID=52283 RepID=A0A834V9K7_SARSC|nr:Putative RNA-binding protein 15B [Sarcoptes scabiei]